jgi:hypothetical protein
VEIGRVEPHGLAELFAGGVAIAGFQERVGEVLADIGTGGGDDRRFSEVLDRGVVIVGAQGFKGFGQGRVRRVLRFLTERGGSDQER